MNAIFELKETRPVTFGDLCEALADRELPAAVEDGYYLLRRGDFKRFVRSATGEQPPMLLDLFIREPARAAS